MATSEIGERGRASLERPAWGDVYEQLSSQDARAGLAVADLERLAVAAHLTGRDEASAAAWERAHQHHLDEGEVAGAVRCAFWLAFGLLTRGEMARGGGWLARARRLAEEHRLEGVEPGYLLIPAARQALEGGDPATAHATFGEALALGERFDDPDLVTLARLGQGSSLIRMGRMDDGLALLDEAMVGVLAEEVSAAVAGTVYCAVILACHEVFDLRRAHEWTAALSDWCDAQPDLVPFRGQCLVHRSEVLQWQGSWREAMEEVERARERLLDPPGQPAVGMAFHQQGELHRLRGELDAAERAYRRASQEGREPQPGLALLWLARGEADAAAAAIRRVLDGARGGLERARLLPATVEILLAVDDPEGARAAADELASLAAAVDAPLLRAQAATAAAAVGLAEGRPKPALEEARAACRDWRVLEAPYEHARARVLAGLACRALGDDRSADLELEAAEQAFGGLGAQPDRARVERLRAGAPRRTRGGPTARELEVLARVAAGRTNRQIAADLGISEHTVRRHLQNLFRKLGVSSRAAAIARAHEHELL